MRLISQPHSLFLQKSYFFSARLGTEKLPVLMALTSTRSSTPPPTPFLNLPLSVSVKLWAKTPSGIGSSIWLLIGLLAVQSASFLLTRVVEPSVLRVTS